MISELSTVRAFVPTRAGLVKLLIETELFNDCIVSKVRTSSGIVVSSP